VLVKQAAEKKLNAEQIRFYLDFFRFGCPPHGGLGLASAECSCPCSASRIPRGVVPFQRPNATRA